jgi:hypothetical protein
MVFIFAGCHEVQTNATCDQIPATARKIPDFILDNTELGFKVEGTWYAGWSDEDYNHGSMWAYGAEMETCRATWEYEIRFTGRYEVYEWHSGDPNYDHADDVPHTIHHAGGTTTVIVDQQRNEARWNSLGTYIFNKETLAVITISNRARGNVVADAIKLVHKPQL